jgi:hypothetical protein
MLERIWKYLTSHHARTAAFAYIAFLYGGAGLLDHSLRLPGSLSSPIFDSSLLLKGVAIALGSVLVFLAWRAPTDERDPNEESQKRGAAASSSR